MEDLYTDDKINVDQIKSNLSILFPELTTFQWNIEEGEPLSFDINNPLHILFTTSYSPDKKEFRFQISIYRTPEDGEEERALYIGQKFASGQKLRVLVNFTHPQFPSNPFYCILFEENKTFLADNSSTNFADDTEELVKIIDTYNLPEYMFDKKANFLGSVSSNIIGPIIGQRVYIPDELYLNHGGDDIAGGIATIEKIETSKQLPNDHYNYLMIGFKEINDSMYSWKYILENQEKWSLIYAGKKAGPNPDLRARFNPRTNEQS